LASAVLSGFSDSGWAKIEIEGEDREIFQEIILRELGHTQTNLGEIENQTNYLGIVNTIGTDLSVDIGIEKPTPQSVAVSPRALRAQLCDGKLLSCKEITEHYCIHAGSKLAVRVTGIGQGARKLEGWLADSQIDVFSNQIASRLERVQVFDCTRQQVEFALRRLNLARDVISVEPSTLTAQSVVCKLGTNAIGLIPKLGSVLRRSALMPFLPARILTRCRQW
jgi:hypothetical protein